MENKKSVFETLSAINVSGKTEKKNGLTYLPWAYAWAEVCKVYPTATYKVFERDTQWGPVNYFTDGRTCWVKVGVTIDGLEYVEMLPVMNFKNQSIPLDKVTSCDTNKAIQRAITKAIGRHGLGLYVYADKGLPDGESQAQNTAQPVKPIEKATVATQAPVQKPVRDTRPVTDQMIGFMKNIIAEYGVTEEFICHKYKASQLQDLKVYQANHICKNISKLKAIFDEEKEKNLNEKKAHIADIVTKNADITVGPVAVMAGQRKMPTTFADAICPPPQQKKTEGEEVSLESLGLSPADLDALTECGNVFN